MKKIKILIPSAGRSDYGIMRNLILNLSNNKKFIVKIISMGAHFSNMFGKTVKEMKNDNLKNIKNIKYNILKNNKNNTNKYMSLILDKVDMFIKNFNPDICIIMGDRYEMLSCALSCTNNNIKIIHLCGGSITLGSLDNLYRKCISILSEFHLVETSHHRSNLINLGINKNKIYITGAPALENIEKLGKFDEILLSQITKLKEKKLVLFTFHSETTVSTQRNIKNLNMTINFLKKLTQKNYFIITTYPNADKNYNQIIKIFKKLEKNNNFIIKKSLGIKNYYNLMKISSFMIGNSSSGIIEALSFKLPVINLGNRQQGRYCESNVIHSNFDENSMFKALAKINSKNFQRRVSKLKNPYKTRKNSKQIIKLIYNLLS